MNNTLMVQGTASDAGKSMMVTALCRIFSDRKKRVAPFKPQNMALNSAVTPEGGEIGRAQAVQAFAARVPLHTDFNPILLKPNSDTGAQVIVQGKAITEMEASQYHDYKQYAMTAVLDSHQRLKSTYELVIAEGAGSPAEINLREGDIANMGFAEAADCPVVLIADIDKGGVFAQIVGTFELLSESEKRRIVGVIINKFRGDIALLKSGLDWLENRISRPVLGVVPYVSGLEIAAEDSINQQNSVTESRCTIAVLVYPRISNHTDFDLLRVHPQINLIFVGPDHDIPACDLIILPGSKNVRADLKHLMSKNWHLAIAKHLRYGGKVLGVCGGYQMLGQTISDELGIEGEIGCSTGLGYLPINTQLKANKTLENTTATLMINNKTIVVEGYEIHAGESELLANAKVAMTNVTGHVIGCIDEEQQVLGSYLHGWFDSNASIAFISDWLGISFDPVLDYASQQDIAINKLAKTVEQSVNITQLESLIYQWA